MDFKKIEKEINNFIKTSIINSKVEDWKDNRIVIGENNNICIQAYSGDFSIQIYRGNNSKIYDKVIKINKKSFFTNYKLYKKHKEIRFYNDNQEKYEYWSECYNLLPIKNIRKEKLKNISNMS